MLFPIIAAVVVLILGGVVCGLYNPPDILPPLVFATFTGALSSYLVFHFYLWKDTFTRNLLFAGAVLLLFGLGLMCGKNITESLHKKVW